MSAIALAPASIGNCAVGFDLLGLAIQGAGDRVEAIRVDRAGVSVRAIHGVVTDLPHDPDRNTAARAVASLLRAEQTPFGVDLVIHKGIALGSGMGGSAASAVAALVATNALLPVPLAAAALYPHALEGECAASGSRHGDNVAPSLFGGLMLAGTHHLQALPTPAGHHSLLVHPDLIVETRLARERLRAPYAIGEFVAQSESLALFLVGLFRQDTALIRAGLRDLLVEPRRADLIPGFHEVKASLLDHGALGASISGAGPSVFGWFESEQAALSARADAIRAFASVGLAATAYISPLDAPGARIETTGTLPWS